MAGRKRRLENAVTAIQRTYGPQALQRGAARAPLPAVTVSTGFPQLDDLTGCRGIPLGAMSTFSGHSTSGKLTLAYKLLANAQDRAKRSKKAASVALVDLAQTADPDYLARCGIDLERLLLVRPEINERAVHLILDLARSRKVSLVVVDNLADLVQLRAVRRVLHHNLRRLAPMLRASNCGLVWIDEPHPPWLRWLRLDARGDLHRYMAVHIEMRREQWLSRQGQVDGYRAQANLLRSRFAPKGGATTIEIRFNGAVHARPTW